MTPLYQSAINLSEGRRPEVIAAIIEVVRAIPEATLADYSADPDHNRMVVTILGDAVAIQKAALAIATETLEWVDLREHTGVHPRIGAVDVVPVVPLRAATMEDAVEVSRKIGRAFAEELGLPVYLYEQSAPRGRRSALPDLRRGGFEGLLSYTLTDDRAPDFGPAVPHPLAGAAVVGARQPLVAYNVNLKVAVGDEVRTVRLVHAVVSSIRRGRESCAELAGVRALGLWLPSQQVAQVSLNLTRPAETPLPAVFDYVRTEARRQGLILDNPIELSDPAFRSEVIGLIPRASLGGEPPERIQWLDYKETQILDYWLERV